jgi:hypothetical protein
MSMSGRAFSKLKRAELAVTAKLPSATIFRNTFIRFVLANAFFVLHI